MALSKRNVWANASALALVAVLYQSLFSDVAYAQGVAAPEAMGPAGIRVGNIEVHPEVSARAGYDSNVYKADDEGESPQSRVESAGIVTVTPGITASTIG